jgi:hypothetical protein
MKPQKAASRVGIQLASNVHLSGTAIIGYRKYPRQVLALQENGLPGFVLS